MIIIHYSRLDPKEHQSTNSAIDYVILSVISLSEALSKRKLLKIWRDLSSPKKETLINSGLPEVADAKERLTALKSYNEKMKTLSPDTNAAAEKIQIELIRKSSVSRRLQTVNSLVKTTRRLSWLGILERYPNETYEFYIEYFVSLLYNDAALARKVRSHLIRMNQT